MSAVAADLRVELTRIARLHQRAARDLDFLRRRAQLRVGRPGALHRFGQRHAGRRGLAGAQCVSGDQHRDADHQHGQ
jgi:hypothetical protein